MPKTKTQQSLKLSLAAIAILSASLAVAQPGGGQGEKRRKPPQEAFTACEELNAGDACSVTTPRGEMEGSCVTPPQGENELLCAPEGGAPAGDPPSE